MELNTGEKVHQSVIMEQNIAEKVFISLYSPIVTSELPARYQPSDNCC